MVTLAYVTSVLFASETAGEIASCEFHCCLTMPVTESFGWLEDKWVLPVTEHVFCLLQKNCFNENCVPSNTLQSHDNSESILKNLNLDISLRRLYELIIS